MLTTPKPSPAPGAGVPVRVIQSAEMIDTHGVKAIATINGVIFSSSTPASPQDAQTINAALVAIGGVA